MPLYPLLFILNILLIPLVHNLDQLDPAQALRPAVLLFLAAAGGLVLVKLLFKDWKYAAYLVFLLTLYFFGLGYLNRFLQDQFANYGLRMDERIFILIATGVLVTLLMKPVWRRLGGRTWLTPYLTLVLALGLLVPAFELLTRLIDQHTASRQATVQSGAGSEALSLDCSNTPDIYYIILDGYGRADMLKDLYDLDNQPFIDTLQSQGFYVAEESHTNYIQTIYTIPSGLNFNFMDPPDQDLLRTKYFSNLVRHNQIMAALKACGYRTMAFESGFYFTEHLVVDNYLANGLGANEYESLLLAGSPVDVLARQLDSGLSRLSYEAHRQRVLYSFEKLGELTQVEEPKFVFAHIISPHPPFVFDALGQPVEPKRSYFIGDGDDYQGSLEEYRAGYPAQVQFVNAKLEQMIESILANSAQPPVIILQGDHGPGSQLVWEAPEQTCLWERTPIFNAYYLPGEGGDKLYPSISPVNSFRVVLNAYFGADLPLLPDSTYFTSHDAVHEAVDITAIRDSHTNCRP